MFHMQLVCVSARRCGVVGITLKMLSKYSVCFVLPWIIDHIVCTSRRKYITEDLYLPLPSQLRIKNSTTGPSRTKIIKLNFIGSKLILN